VEVIKGAVYFGPGRGFKECPCGCPVGEWLDFMRGIWHTLPLNQE
jgi:hypothetical protein